MARSDEELALSASRGDMGALDQLLESNLPKLRAFVRLQMGSALRAREESLDVVQSICREVLEHQERFKSGGPEGFRRWLFTTAIRLIRNKAKFWQRDRRAARHEARIPEHDSGIDPVADCYRTFLTPSRDAGAREEVARFEAAFDALPEDYREVIALTRIVGLPHKEVAEQMDRSELATRALLHRALASLAEALDPPSR